MSEIAIKKMTIQLGKKEVELTIEEAKQLHEALGNLFGSKEVIREYHYEDKDRWDWIRPKRVWLTGSAKFEMKDPGLLLCSVKGEHNG